jgi:hypothetical protein
MISERDLRLLTAAADGELTPHERQRLDELLRRSPEARTLERELRADARRLRELPPVTLSTDLSARVLREIAGRRPTPARTAPAAFEWQRVAILANFAAAAAVFVAVGAAVFYLSQPPRLVNPGGPVAIVAVPAEPKTAPQDPVEPQLPLTPEPGPEQIAPPVRVVEDDSATPTPAPEPPARAVITAPSTPSPKLVEVAPGTRPTFLVAADLAAADGPGRLAAALAALDVPRVDVVCGDPLKAFEACRVTLGSGKTRFLTEPTVTERLRRRPIGHALLFIEGVPAEQVGKRLAQAAGRSAGGVDSVVVTPVSAADRRELAAALGLDPFAPRPRPTGPLGLDPRKPVADGTAGQLSQALAGQGGESPGAAKGGKPAAAGAFVLAMPYPPGRPAAALSREAKAILDARPAGPRPVVMVVLRPLKG